METTLLAQRDRRTIWHPFTQMKTAAPPLPIVRGEGTWLIAEDGRRYLDSFSSWWVNLHGHSHPYLVNALVEQAKKLEHVVFTDFTHEPAVKLAEKLLQLLPSAYSKVFYSDNGATAVEAALKMVFQYWHNRDGDSKKQGIVCFKNGYHGDTFGAMAVAGKGEFNRPFWPFLFNVIAIDPPVEGGEEESLRQLEEAAAVHELAGFIFEPQIQGVGGMKTHSLAGLDALIDYCHRRGILTIADEVMTGFGRTGPHFVCGKLKNPPSIVCLAKGLTGGMLPLAATVCQQFVFDAFLSEDKQKAFLHGHSYYGNPLACAAALASLTLLDTAECRDQRLRIERQHQTFCRQWRGHPSLCRLEALGTILAAEYRGEGSYYHPISGKIKQFFFDRGVLARPFGNVLHIMPPYCIEEEELERIYRLIIHTLEHPL